MIMSQPRYDRGFLRACKIPIQGNCNFEFSLEGICQLDYLNLIGLDAHLCTYLLCKQYVTTGTAKITSLQKDTAPRFKLLLHHDQAVLDILNPVILSDKPNSFD